LGFGRVWKVSTRNYKVHGEDMSSPLQFLFDWTVRINTSKTRKQFITQVKVEPLDFQFIFDLNDDTDDDDVMVLLYPTLLSRFVKHNGATILGPLVLKGPPPSTPFIFYVSSNIVKLCN
jgi:hypothetical protein